MILSRYGDTMVTLLGGELAAGAFGRSLAAISSQAAGGGGQGPSTTELGTARTNLNTARELVATRRGEFATADATARSEQTPENIGAAEAAFQNLRAAERAELEANMAMMRLELQGASGSFAQTIATAAGGILAQPSKDIAENVVKMQTNYLESGKVAPLLAACVSTLDHREKGASITPFGKICETTVMVNVAKMIDPEEMLKLRKAKAAFQNLKSTESSKQFYKDQCIPEEGKTLKPELDVFCKFLLQEMKAFSDQMKSTRSLIVPSHPAVAEAEIPATAAGRRYVAAGQLPWLAAALRSTPPSMTQ